MKRPGQRKWGQDVEGQAAATAGKGWGTAPALLDEHGATVGCRWLYSHRAPLPHLKMPPGPATEPHRSAQKLPGTAASMALGRGGAAANLANAAAVAAVGPPWDAAAPGAACAVSSGTSTVIWIAAGVQKAGNGSPPIETFGCGQAAVQREARAACTDTWSVNSTAGNSRSLELDFCTATCFCVTHKGSLPPEPCRSAHQS